MARGIVMASGCIAAAGLEIKLHAGDSPRETARS